MKCNKTMNNDGSYDFSIEIGQEDVIQVFVGTDGRASITSTLKEEIETSEYRDYNNTIDGLESLILALAAEGCDLTDVHIMRAIGAAVECIGNNCV